MKFFEDLTPSQGNVFAISGEFGRILCRMLSLDSGLPAYLSH